MSEKVITIYHNPKCSKSRQALSLLHDNGIEPKIINYIENPLKLAELQQLHHLLKVDVNQLIRKQEALYREQYAPDIVLSTDECLALLENHPSLLQRPIVATPDRAIIGRPPENVLELIAD